MGSIGLQQAFRELAIEREWELVAVESQFKVGVAARLRGMSPRNLNREFHSTFQCSPKKWFKHQQLAVAMKWLLESRSVKMAAYSSGYTHVGNFSRDFKREFGITPTEFLTLDRNSSGQF